MKSDTVRVYPKIWFVRCLLKKRLRMNPVIIAIVVINRKVISGLK